MDVVIRDDEQPGRIGEGRVVGEPARIGVAVRAHDREPFDRAVELSRHVPHGGLGGEQAVGVKGEGRSLNGHGFPPAGRRDVATTLDSTFAHFGLKVKWSGQLEPYRENEATT